MRPAFVLASLGVIASWSVGGLYLALAPSLAGHLFGTDSHLAGGAVVLALGGPAGLAQLALHRLSPRAAMGAGSLALALGMAGTVASLSTGSVPLFLAVSVVTGAGFGVAFMGAIRSVSLAAPLEHRAAVMSAFYVVAYLSLSIPTVIAGFVVPGLGLEPTFRIFGSVVVALALVTALGTRSRTMGAAAAAS
jgi:MFS family permease